MLQNYVVAPDLSDHKPKEVLGWLAPSQQSDSKNQVVETIGTVEENAYSLVCEFIKEKSLLKTTMNSIRFRSLLTELDWQKQNQTALTRLQSHQKLSPTKVILKRNGTENSVIKRGDGIATN